MALILRLPHCSITLTFSLSLILVCSTFFLFSIFEGCHPSRRAFLVDMKNNGPLFIYIAKLLPLMIFFSLRSYDLAIFTRVFLIIIYFIYFYRSFTKHIEYNDLLSYFFYLFWKIETSTSSFAAIYTLIANRENIHEHIPWITRDRFTAESEPFQFSQSEEKNRWLRSGADGITGPTQTWGKIRPIVFPESSGEWLPRDDLHFASSLTRRDIETFSNFSVPPTNILAHRMKRAFPSSFFSLNRLETNFRA